MPTVDDIDRVCEDIRMGLQCQTMHESVAGDGTSGMKCVTRTADNSSMD